MGLRFGIILHLSILVSIIKSFAFYPSSTLFQPAEKQSFMLQAQRESNVRLLSLFPSDFDRFPGVQKRQYTDHYFEYLPSHKKSTPLPQMFTRVPNLTQINSIIDKRDEYLLIRAATSIDSSSLSCNQKKELVQKTMEMIKGYLSGEDQKVRELQQRKRTVLIEIERLKELVKMRKNELNSLGIQSLKQSLSLKQQVLRKAQAQINELSYNISANNKNKAALEEKLNSTKHLNSQIQTKKMQKRADLKAVKDVIEKQKSDFKKILEILPKVIRNVEILENNIVIYQKFIQQSQANLSVLDDQIKRRNALAKALKETYQVLEVEIETSRTNITTIQKRRTEISILIPNLEKRAQIQEQKTNQSQSITLNRFISFVEALEPEMKSIIDLQFYLCNQFNQVTKQSAIFKLGASASTQNDSSSFERIPSFFVPSTKYKLFLQRYYQVNQTINLPMLEENDLIVITPVRILDKLWGVLFGKPYKESSYIYTNQFLFNEDFKCSSRKEKDVDYLSGVIKMIQGKKIIIQREGRKLSVNLAACSRIDIINGIIPLPGKKIYFRGSKVDNQTYHLYEAITL